MWRILHGDCLSKMARMAPNTIDAIVTDPPYGLGFMGKDWDCGVPGIVFWQEMLRVAKPGAHLLAFGGTRTHHRLMCAIEDAGWEIRDVLCWLYGSGFPKSLNVSKAIEAHLLYGGSNTRRLRQTEQDGDGEPYVLHGRNNGILGEERAWNRRTFAPGTTDARRWNGWGTALKPAWESIVWATKPVDCATIDANLSRIEADLWLLLSASGVALPSPSSPSVSDAGLFDGAQWSADGSISTS